jgi:4-hydroxy-tetrahydrodipicolinate synthase
VIIATANADFSVLTGTDTLLVPSLAMGAAGTIAGSVNLVPDLVSGIYRAFRAGDMAAAVRSQRRLAGIVGLCRPGFFPSGWKAALEAVGVCGRSPVPPGTALTDAEAKRLAEELAAMGVA